MMEKKVTAYLFIIPEFVTIFKEHATELIKKSRVETGNIFYNLYEDVICPGKFVFIEVYVNKQAMDSHFKSAHLATFVEQIAGMQEKEMIVEINTD